MQGETLGRPRDYGGWRRSRGIGLLGLGATGMLIALGALLVLLVAAAVNLRVLVYVGPPALAGGVAGLIKVDGEAMAVVALRRVRWLYGSARKQTAFRASAARDWSPVHPLPGVLAPCELLEADDGYGRRYGLILDRRTGHLTVSWRVVPASMWLADRDEADGWVANWGGWLASLGYQPALRWVTVTVDTSPELGSALADSVAAALDPAAPPAARQIMSELVQAAPAAAARIDTRVSVTVDPRALATGPRTLTEALAETGRTLYGLESALGGCGISVRGRMTAAEIAGTVRAAFSPAARPQASRIAAEADVGAGRSGWDRAGPAGAEELADRYRHDSGTSVSWAWHEPPRQNVTADVLARLVAPGRHPKRVSLQYRPLPVTAATRLLDSEVNAALFRAHYRRRTGRDETARDAFDQARARQAAAEEASGAGVCLISLYATVTVTDEADLPRAVAGLEAAADASKMRLRRLTYSHAAGFAATLPCGICPAELAGRMPR